MTKPLNVLRLKDSLSAIDRWLAYRISEGWLPGLQIAVSHKRSLLLSKAYGVSNRETGVKLSSDHAFRVASISKSFTAVAILQLVEKGEIRLDSPASEYLTWLRRAKDRRVRTITVRQLLSHASGLIRDGKRCEFWELGAEFPKVSEFRKLVQQKKLYREPLSGFKYSNVGFAILGQVIERVTGLSYGKYLEKNIFRALGLNRTSADLSDAALKHLCTGHSRASFGPDEKVLEHIGTNHFASATGLCANAEDLIRFADALMPGSRKLLRESSKREMLRVETRIERDDFEYGLGVHRVSLGGRRLIGHTGGFPGFITRYAIDPEWKLSVAILTNSLNDHVPSILKGIVELIAYCQAYPEYASDSKRRSLSRPELARFTGGLSSLWFDKEVVRVGNGLLMFQVNTWDPVESLSELEYLRGNTFRIHTRNCNWPAHLEEMSFKLNRNNKLASARMGGFLLKAADS